MAGSSTGGGDVKSLIHSYEGPPGGWRYYFEETKTPIKASTREGLERSYVEHCQSNNLPIGLDYWAKIEDWICNDRQLDENHCTNSERPRHAQSGRLTLAQVWTGTVTLAHWKVTGSQKVSKEEANRRAEICSTCEYNQTFDGCQGCHSETLRTVVESIVGGEKTDYDAKLNACQLCGCALKAKVQMPLDILKKHTPQDIQTALPAHCWLK